MLKIKQKIAGVLLLVIVLVGFSGCGLKEPNPTPYTMELEVWGLFDDTDAYANIFENYTKLNPAIIKINYRKLTPDTYRRDLLDALASGQGPDIFLIHNTWLPSFKNKVVAAPTDIFNVQKFKQDFVDVAIADFLDADGVEAVPLSVDSLGLYYNKDLFNRAGITRPPVTWDELVMASRQMTIAGPNDQIIQSGVALGTATNINRATDILSLLMMQNGTMMMDDSRTRVTFDSISSVNNESVSPGANALDFYTSFARSTSAFYTWNSKLHYSTDAFSEGSVAMMLNYSYMRPIIEAKAPKLNYEVAPIPQMPGKAPMNYANYWGFAVAKNKVIAADPGSGVAQTPVSNETRIKEAWKFLTFLTARPAQLDATTAAMFTQKGVSPDFDPAIDFLTKTQKPAARKDLIERQKADPVNGVFAAQNLIAKSWYQANPEAVEGIFAEMITQVNLGETNVAETIKTAATRVSQSMGIK